MRLIDTATGDEAVVGNTYKGYKLTHFREPHKPSSSGKCSVEVNGDTCEYYVGVLGLEWIEREDRKPLEWVTIRDDNVRGIWQNPTTGEEVAVSPDYYQENGVPICTETEADFEYLRTEVRL